MTKAAPSLDDRPRLQRAADLAGIKRALTPAPLGRDDLDEFYVDTSAARDDVVSPRTRLVDRLDARSNGKVLFAGDRGSGKSTELAVFTRETAAKFAVVPLSLRLEQVSGNVSGASLLVLLLEALLRNAERLEFDVDPALVSQVYEWFSQTFHEVETRRQAAVEAGAGAKLEDVWWGKLLPLSASIKAQIKAGSNIVDKTITQDSRRLSELVTSCDLIFREANLTLFERHRRRLLLLVEDLEKEPLATVDQIFIDNPAPLTQISCSAVYTAPLGLLCSPRAAYLQNEFEVVIFPMIRVTEKDGTPCTVGRQIVRDILDRRLDTAALIDPGALEDAIVFTGGVLRHLFDVLTDAALAASEAARRGRRTGAHPRIDRSDVRYGLNQLKRTLLTRVSTYGLPEPYQAVTTEALWARLRERVGKAERVVSDTENLLLISAQVLLEYNGEGWARLHPLVEEELTGNAKR